MTDQTQKAKLQSTAFLSESDRKIAQYQLDNAGAGASDVEKSAEQAPTAADTTSTTDPVLSAEAAGAAAPVLDRETLEDHLADALNAFGKAWRDVMDNPSPENLERVDVIFEIARKAEENKAEREKKIAERQASLHRECVCFATGLVGHMVAEFVIDILPESKDQRPDVDTSVLSYAITMVTEQLEAAFESHKFYSFESMVDLKYIKR